MRRQLQNHSTLTSKIEAFSTNELVLQEDKQISSAGSEA